MLAKNAIETGHVDCALALGFEKMKRGSLSSQVMLFKNFKKLDLKYFIIHLEFSTMIVLIQWKNTLKL